MKNLMSKVVIFIALISALGASSLFAIDEVDVQSNELSAQEENAVVSKWQKRGMFLLGCINGFYLPLTYALALGLNVVDLSHPVMEENLKPFAKGATLGIGCWFAYKIVEWYLQLALLKTLNSALQNPVINKIVRENEIVAAS